MRRVLFALATATAVATISPSAPADDAGAAPATKDTACELSTEVILLHGTNEGSGIDPKIGKMPELAKPPFSSYNSYKLLDRVKPCLAKSKSATVKLPTGRDLMVTFKDVIEPKKKDDAKRYVISASIQKPGGNTFLPLLEVNAKAGETFFVAGQDYKGGMLVIGIKLTP